MKRRRLALSQVKWSEDVKEETELVLNKEYTSPEKDGIDGARWRLPLEWESSRLSKRKLELDRVYTAEVLKPIQKMRLGRVMDHPAELVRTPPPAAAPAWVISKKFKWTFVSFPCFVTWAIFTCWFIVMYYCHANLILFIINNTDLIC